MGVDHSGLFDGIDVKADGGYIATGPGYQWVNDEDIATLTEAQCELLTRPAKLPLSQEGVSAADIAGICHGNWHEPVLRLVGKLVAKGIDDQTILALTDRFTIPDYTVAQTRSDVAEMIRGAREKGWAPEVPETRQTPFLSSLDVFLADPPDWRVEGLLPERGVGILVGGEGSGKTFVAIDLCMAIANGTAFASNHPTTRGRVLYAAAEDRDIETPVAPMTAQVLAHSAPVLVSILRAGNAMLDGVLDLLPMASVAHIGMYRDHETLEAIEYSFNGPPDIAERLNLVVDPMLATANSGIAAISRLKEKGVRDLRMMSILAAPEGLTAFAAAHPDVPVFVGEVDERLNEKGYIVPGLGDAGDRSYCT